MSGQLFDRTTFCTVVRTIASRHVRQIEYNYIFIQLFIHIITRSNRCSFTNLFVHTAVRSYDYPFIQLFVHDVICSHSCQFIKLFAHTAVRTIVPETVRIAVRATVRVDKDPSD